MLFQVHQFEHFPDAFLSIRFVHLANFQTEADVLTDGQIREEGIGLEHHAHIALIGRFLGDVLAVQGDGTGIDRFKSGDHAQGGGFTAAGRSEEGHKFALFHLEVEILHRRNAAVDFGNVGKGQVSHRFTISVE